MSNQFIASVEKRVFTWKELQKKRKEQDMESKPPRTSITISREFGCDGYPLAVALKTSLDQKTGQNWTIFDDDLIVKIASDNSISKHLIKKFGERAKYLDYIIASLLPNWKSETEIFKLIVETVFSVAQQGNSIIIGRGAFAITKDLPNCYHFRLIAPLEYRAKSYALRTNISEEEAKRIVEEKEESRTRFLSDFLNCGFDHDNFHLVLNNEKISPERMADTILYLIKDTI
ncbi:cytidylate kinase-like family protein [bacterium]|nr:cytidylate kinase-like family protein [bacterium]